MESLELSSIFQCMSSIRIFNVNYIEKTKHDLLYACGNQFPFGFQHLWLALTKFFKNLKMWISVDQRNHCSVLLSDSKIIYSENIENFMSGDEIYMFNGQILNEIEPNTLFFFASRILHYLRKIHPCSDRCEIV